MKRMRILIVLVIALLFPASDVGGEEIIGEPGKQNETIKEESEPGHTAVPDEKRIEGTSDLPEAGPSIDDFSERFTIRPFLAVPLQALVIQPSSSNSRALRSLIGGDSDAGSASPVTRKSITYFPNFKLAGGLGLSYWVFGISAQMAFQGTAKPERRYGRTRFIDLQLHYYFRKLGVDVFYQDYRGYYLESPRRYNGWVYLENTPVYMSYRRGDPGTLRSDLRIATIGFNVFYVFSDNYSLDAAFKQTERQNRRGGSFLLMLSGINYRVSASSSLLPLTQEWLYGVYHGFKGGNFASLGLAPGYSYTFLIGRGYFITPVVFIGAGLTADSLKMQRTPQELLAGRDGEKSKLEAFLKTNLRLAVGYNGDSFFYGLAGVLDISASQGFNKTSISVGLYRGYCETFAGYRF